MKRTNTKLKRHRRITTEELDQAAIVAERSPIDGLPGNLGIVKEACLEFSRSPSDRMVLAKLICVIDSTNSAGLSRQKRVSNFGVMNIADFCLQHGFPEIVRLREPRCVDCFIDGFSKSCTSPVDLKSFFSKLFCYYDFFALKNDDFSIYDSVVSSQLKRYSIAQVNEGYSSSGWYERYNERIGKILDANGIYASTYPLRRRHFDNLLWMAPRKKKKSQRNKKNKRRKGRAKSSVKAKVAVPKP
jgi:hypothetical protein